MAQKTLNDVTNTQAEWDVGTLTGVQATVGGLQIAKNPVIYRCDFDDISGWSPRSGRTGTISKVGGPSRTGNAGQTVSGVTWMADTSVTLPYDPAKLYELSAMVQVTSSSTDPSRIYIGVEGIASDGTTLINASGDNVEGGQHYHAASSYYLKKEEGWKTFRGYFSGHGTSGLSNSHDPSNPGKMYTGVAYIRPLFILNYDRPDGVSEIAYIQIKEVGDNSNHALGKSAYSSHPLNQPISRLTDGDRDTNNYVGTNNNVDDVYNGMTIDLGALYPINQIGVWHYYADGRTYYKTRTEVASGPPALYQTPTPLIDYSQWVVGTTGDQGNFRANGPDSENAIIEKVDPFGFEVPVWECIPDAANDADGGWRVTFPVDETKTYMLSCWVKIRADEGVLADDDGSTYHGCSQTTTENLDGTSNGNPYFWSGQLPGRERWYLAVGILHPSGYTGGDTGRAGLYSRGGTKVVNGTEFRIKAGATEQEARTFKYYATNTSVRQYQVYPRIDILEEGAPNPYDLAMAQAWHTVFDFSLSGEYAEDSGGKWHGFETHYIRYIRDIIRGSTSNQGDHWVEIEAYGEAEQPSTATRTKPVSLEPVGRISGASIDWKGRSGLMVGAGTYVHVNVVPAHSITSEITIEAEICWTGAPAEVGSGRSAILTVAIGYYFQVVDDGRLACYTYQPDGTVSSYTYSNTSLAAGTWYHVAFTEDTSGYRRLFIETVEDVGEQKEPGIRDTALQDHNLGIGKQLGNYYRDLTAGLREVRLWDHARSAAQLAANKGVRLQGNETGLRGYWPLDEGAGTVANDLTGNADGLVSNPRWLTYTVETNVSLDGGSTWQGWKTATPGGAIADIPADADGRDVIVDCRQTLDGTGCEATPQIDSLTISATGNRAVMKAWNGSAWVDATPKVWDGSQHKLADPRVFTDGRWL